MKERLRRSVTVDAPLDVAWNYLSQPEDWPQTWAGHLRRVECDPPGSLTATTRGVVHMRVGFTARMTMVEFRPGHNWKWVGKGGPGLRTAFDHRFEKLDENRTRIDFVVETEGFLEPIFGPLTALYLGRKLDRNLPSLVSHLNGLAQKE
jgi:uncharacterized membrane protein